ncbi:MAG: hypothetical protein HY644_05255 [Acidobacteria bacterium]|nr:hypothetical protein [Acidobacteriota bacterium]
MLSMQELKELEQKVKDVICPVCTERRPDGTCELTEQECPISVHLPRLVQIVSSVHSNRMEDYVQKVRDDVCSICRTTLSPRGQCNWRAEGHCALDAYLLPIVEVIDDFLVGKASIPSPK